MGIVIPIPEAHKTALKQALDRFAPYNWEERRNVHIFSIASGQPPKVTLTELSSFCQNNNIKTILIPNRVQCEERSLKKAGYQVQNVESIAAFIHGDALQKHLRTFGFDWRSEAIGRLKYYDHGIIDEAAVNTWLAQFERLGNHRAVGEHLLQLLEVLPASVLGDSLCVDAAFFGDDLVIGFNKDKWGKSWAPISNLISKKCDLAEVLPINDALVAAKSPKVLRVVEDGLFSGTEAVGIFDSLLGLRTSGQTQKVPKLDDATLLSRIPIQIQYGVICDFGEARLRRYLTDNSLVNVQVAVGSATRKIRVLLKSPHSSGTDDSLPFKEQLESRVSPFAFQDDKGWKDSKANRRALTFCEAIGEQLWRNYLEKKFGRDALSNGRWPKDRIKCCALGMDGLGLTFAFSHSVPKASLPLFWSRGKVNFAETTLDWYPLFPSADT